MGQSTDCSVTTSVCETPMHQSQRYRWHSRLDSLGPVPAHHRSHQLPQAGGHHKLVLMDKAGELLVANQQPQVGAHHHQYRTPTSLVGGASRQRLRRVGAVRKLQMHPELLLSLLQDSTKAKVKQLARCRKLAATHLRPRSCLLPVRKRFRQDGRKHNPPPQPKSHQMQDSSRSMIV